tara:strand:+ start:1211 stop:1585 length:375 start_codon:yes stop_codon:yes gene_type:complete
MPRLPVDGKKVIEHRITLGTKERQLLQDVATSYRIDAISGDDSIIEVLGDFGKLTAVLAAVGGILEILGITDVFDFDDSIKAEVMGIKKKIVDNEKKAIATRAAVSDREREIFKRIFEQLGGVL